MVVLPIGLREKLMLARKKWFIDGSEEFSKFLIISLVFKAVKKWIKERQAEELRRGAGVVRESSAP